MPEISVVVVTYNRPDMLALLIDGLLQQTVRAELIVCDDGSKIVPNYLIDRLDRYNWVADDGRYHRVARFNEGCKFATAPCILLLDDDTIPAGATYLQAHLTGLGYADVCRGMGVNSDGKPELPPWFSSTNLSMHREVAEKFGPFDPAYDGNYGYEDTDLGCHLEQAGVSIIPGDAFTSAEHYGRPYSGDRDSQKINHDYYCKKWGIANA